MVIRCNVAHIVCVECECIHGHMMPPGHIKSLRRHLVVLVLWQTYEVALLHILVGRAVCVCDVYVLVCLCVGVYAYKNHIPEPVAIF